MDIRIKQALNNEVERQQDNIELIASENFVSEDVLTIQGSVFTNKYAEGYPGKRYYGGCENMDTVENIAREYATKLFGCSYANVQPHSGSSANMAVYKALLSVGDKILGMNLSHGGHLTHGFPINFSGMDYVAISYDVNIETGLIDYDALIEKAKIEQPKIIVAGASAYPRTIDFKKFREAADTCGAVLMVDIAHIAGLIAAGLHPSPFPYADVVTSTTHKTLRGPRGGLILTNNEEIAKKVDKIIFPGIQGGPLMHVIAAKAQCFYEALQPEFINYQKRVIENANALAESLIEEGLSIISGGTDTHLLLVDVKNTMNITGKDAEEVLDNVHITCNKNTIPGETESPSKASGIRLGSPAMTSRGLNKDDFKEIGKIIAEVLKNKDNEEVLSKIKDQVLNLTKKYPLYEGLQYE